MTDPLLEIATPVVRRFEVVVDAIVAGEIAAQRTMLDAGAEVDTTEENHVDLVLEWFHAQTYLAKTNFHFYIAQYESALHSSAHGLSHRLSLCRHTRCPTVRQNNTIATVTKQLAAI